MAQETQTGALYQPSGEGKGGRWEGVSKWRDVCISMADSCQCMAKPIQYCKVKK